MTKTNKRGLGLTKRFILVLFKAGESDVFALLSHYWADRMDGVVFINLRPGLIVL